MMLEELKELADSPSPSRIAEYKAPRTAALTAPRTAVISNPASQGMVLGAASCQCA